MNSAPLIFCPCHNYDDGYELHFSGPLLVDVAIYGMIMEGTIYMIDTRNLYVPHQIKKKYFVDSQLLRKPVY